MASLDYVDIPPGATRLRSSSSSSGSNMKRSISTSSDLRTAPKIYTNLPNPAASSSSTQHARQNSLSSFSASSLTSPTLSFIPQLLLSSTIPGGVGAAGDDATPTDASTAATSSSNPRQSLYPEKYTLLSTKDPLSLPIMSNNFKRFVSKIGPVFWLQDRIEEIVLWKKGWKVTGTWMALYAFLCFYPRMVLLVPHAVIIGVILATYPYEKNGGAAGTTNAQTTQAGEGSVPWQANIQAIQNLMGAVSDAFTAIEPHVHHLILSPAHFKDPDTQTQTTPTSRPISPYTPHLLVLLAVSFPILAFIISLPTFPIRQVFLFGGLAPFVATHPWILRLRPYIVAATPIALNKLEGIQQRLRARYFSNSKFGPLVPISSPSEGDSNSAKSPTRLPIKMVLQRVIDDDRLTDACWNAEMREVELWENERLGGEPQSPHPGSDPLPSNGMGNAGAQQTVGWSKANLRPGERVAWTRGRDGWNGVGVGGSGGLDGQGEVSNLTFSLAPGWAFVETEDWRRDVLGTWSGVGADADGWVYTNDAWLGARPAPYTAGGGSVTRRRRWVRRVWYDKERAEKES